MWPLLSPQDPFNPSTQEGRTPLFEACLNGHEQVVRSLLQAKADTGKADLLGRTPLSPAFCFFVANLSFHLLICFPLLVLKGIYDYWKYIFFAGGLSK